MSNQTPAHGGQVSSSGATMVGGESDFLRDQYDKTENQNGR
jgi:hypothetical protein